MDIDFKKLAPGTGSKRSRKNNRALPRCRCSAMTCRCRVGPSVPSCNCIARSTACSTTRSEASVSRRWPCHAGRRTGRMLKPALDIQTDKQYKIALEVPGVDEKDIQITLDNDVLLVRGEKRQEQETKDGGFHRVERSYGSFQRALNLPADANQDTIKAAFKNGVLTITMEKREASTPKQGRSIPING